MSKGKPERGHPGQIRFAWKLEPEDAELIRSIQAGNRNGAFDALVKRHGGLIWKILRRFVQSSEQEEAYQAGILGLWEAARHYDFTRPDAASFSTVAAYWIEQRYKREVIWKPVNERNLSKNTCSLDAQVGGEGEGSLAEIVTDDREEPPGEERPAAG